MKTYLLDNRKRAYSVSVSEWGNAFEWALTRRVKNKIIQGNRISTVFLGVDHNFWGANKPLIFETMVFEGGLYDEIYVMRYSTYKEAQKGHRKAIKWVRNGCVYGKRPSKIIRDKQKSIKIFINK